MPDGKEAITIQVANSIADYPAAQWDACVTDGNPFLRHGFLSALEDSGSVTAETGWLPQHLAINDPSGTLLAAAPLYLKSHSYGEYVFDWGLGRSLQSAPAASIIQSCNVPCPSLRSPGPACWCGPTPRGPGLQAALLTGMIRLAERHGVSSLHITFPTRSEWQDHGRVRTAAANWTPIPLGQPRLRQLRRVLGHPDFAQAQDHSQGTAKGRR